MRCFLVSRSTTFALALYCSAHVPAVGQISPDAVKDVPAIIRLLESGGTENGDVVEVKEDLAQIARSGNIQAASYLGERYLVGGNQFARDLPLAEEFLTIAAEAHPRSRYLLGVLQLQDKSTSRAVENLKAAFEQGYSRAGGALGEFLSSDAAGDARDFTEAVRYLDAALSAGDQQAEVLLTRLLLEEPSVLDVNRGVDLLRSRGSQGDQAALYRWAMIKRVGEYGVSRDVSAAEDALRRLHKEGYEPAQLSLASLLITSEDPLDVEEGAQLLKTAYQAGITGASAMWAELLLVGGAGVGKDVNEAIQILDEAAQSGSVPAIRSLISIYRSGRFGETKDIDKSEVYTSLLKEKHSELAEVESVINRIAVRPSFEALQAAWRIFDTQNIVPRAEFLAKLYAVSPNSAVYIVQNVLTAKGVYSGELNGMATRATLRAIMEACRNFPTIDGDCSDGPIRLDYLTRLVA